jgi:high affinity Mn2+ porin
MSLRRLLARSSFALLGASLFLSSPAAHAEVAEPSGRADEAFDFMNLLAHHGIHDIDDEAWNAYGQITDIYSLKLAFPAAYTNLNGSNHSLLPEQQFSFTETATAFVGLRLWPGAEAYIVPELIAEQPLSNLAGLGGAIQNFELQKQGKTVPSPYLARAYLRQTFNFGGDRVVQSSDPMQLGRVDRKRRFVVTLGNYSILDFFDKNSTIGDLRKSFFNMGFLTYAAYDFAADARGYTWAATGELFYDDWSFRIARAAAPKDPNQLPIDFRIDKYYGDQIEIEHDHHLFGQDGAVRVLAYRNQENMGKFSDAIAAYESAPALNNAAACMTPKNPPFNYGSTNATAPDLCWVRKTNVKVGAGVSIEQRVDNDIGLFFRGMISDGQTEVYSYTSTDSSISFGGISYGTKWKRPGDTVGLGWSQGWISSEHARYLAMGGVDGFIGDGALKQASEQVLEFFYSFSMGSSSWLSVDYQHIWNPAYNGDRGGVDIFGGRAHVEF